MGTDAELTALAPAKVNLTLHLTGLRADGYHLLDSLVVFAGTGDRLMVRPAADLSLTVTGPRAAGVPTDGTNLVLRAAERLRALRGTSAGAAITLEKHLPHGGGIGGGSSDAATAIRLLARLWDVAPLTVAEALPLGADVPVCLQSPAPTRMRGIGEDLSPVPALPPGWLVLVNPGRPVATGPAFRAHDSRFAFDPMGLAALDDASPAGFARWLAAHRNDLTRVATQPDFVPEIAGIIARLAASPGAVKADMSGSGSTVWGWFELEAQARAAASALGAPTGWWIATAPVLTGGGAAPQAIRSTT